MLEKITNSTIAWYNGAIIFCPECAGAMKVKNFDWDKLECKNCKKVFSKDQYQFESNSKHLIIHDFGAVAYRLLPPQLESIINRTPDLVLSGQAIQKLLEMRKSELQNLVRHNLYEVVYSNKFDDPKKAFAAVYDLTAKQLYEKEEKL